MDMSATEYKIGVGDLQPIGRVASPLLDPRDCPRQPDEDAAPATLILRPEMTTAATGLQVNDRILVITWLHLTDRTTLVNQPRGDVSREPKGVFATRSEDRPNPIGIHQTTITRVDGNEIEVAELEAIDGTPILDIKPVLGPISDR